MAKDRTKRVSATMLVLSIVGATMITQWEGFEETAYKDLAGITTIGVGSTYLPAGTEYTLDGKTYIAKSKTKVIMGMRLTSSEAKRIAIDEAEKTFGKGAVGKCISAPINQNEYDAYTSLAYNIGPKAFCASTLVKMVNLERYAEGCKQLLRWTYSNGKYVRGLYNRRSEEFRLCMKND